MARRPADIYVKESQLDDYGTHVAHRFFAVYNVIGTRPEGAHQEEITQQAWSAARNRGANCAIRLIVPGHIEVRREQMCS